MADEPSQAELKRNQQAIDEQLSLREQVEREVEEIVIGARKYTFRPEPRCRICQNPEVNAEVNRLLVRGMSYSGILTGLGSLLADVPEPDHPGYSTVRTHAKKHFAADEAGLGAYRDILERRALEADKDFVQGMASAVTPLAYLETLMVRGYESMTNLPDGEVSTELGLKAAMRLQEISVTEDSDERVALMTSQANQMIGAVRSVVPAEYWDQIVALLDTDDPDSAAEVIELDAVTEPED